MEPRAGSNPAKNLRIYVQSGWQPCQDKPGRVFVQVWNPTQPNHWPNTRLLAGYPDLFLTLLVGLEIKATTYRSTIFKTHVLRLYFHLWIYVSI